MCPFCIATATLIAASGVASLGGAATFAALKLRAVRLAPIRVATTPEPADSQNEMKGGRDET